MKNLIAVVGRPVEKQKARKSSLRREERDGSVVFIWSDPSWVGGRK